MLFFGHIGIGTKMVSPWSEGLPKRWLWLGTLLPDLIDKPLYYGLAFVTGRWGGDLGLISGTRTFGHTALFLVVLAAFATLRRSPAAAALALGTATHLFLDNLADHFSAHSDSSALIALLFPFYRSSFATIPHLSMLEHLRAHFSRFLLGAEIAGLALLAWDHWQDLHRKEILSFFQMRRLRQRFLKRQGRGLRSSNPRT